MFNINFIERKVNILSSYNKFLFIAKSMGLNMCIVSREGRCLHPVQYKDV